METCQGLGRGNMSVLGEREREREREREHMIHAIWLVAMFTLRRSKGVYTPIAACYEL